MLMVDGYRHPTYVAVIMVMMVVVDMVMMTGNHLCPSAANKPRIRADDFRLRRQLTFLCRLHHLINWVSKRE
jgi:hypothetical protein